jgi:lactoylglutathione lyase
MEEQEESLKFYQDVMGMTLMRTSENSANGFNLYFLGYPGGYDYKSSANGVNPVAGKEGILELTWNYGTGMFGSSPATSIYFKVKAESIPLMTRNE